jgi:TP901 family phage tail tape measure protein
MADGLIKVGILMQLVDRLSGPMRQQVAGVEAMTKRIDRLRASSERLSAVGRNAFLGGSALAAGAGLGGFFSQAVETEHKLAAIANTAGIGFEKAKATTAGWKLEIAELSRATNQLQSELTDTLGIFSAKGMDPNAALAALKPTGDAATATMANMGDLARTAYAAIDNLKVPVQNLEKTFNQLTYAGNQGAFELRDMSIYFPGLTASAAALGMKGTEAIAQLGAASQIALKGASDPSQAANNFQNFLMKLSAPETVRNFKKFGVNLRKEMEKGLMSGDVIQHFTELITRVTGGDSLKMGELFGDMQVKQFLQPMIANLEEYKRIRDGALNAGDVVGGQKDVMEDTIAEQWKGFQINMSAIMQSSNALSSILGSVNTVLANINKDASATKWIFNGIATLVVGGGGLWVAAKVFLGISAAVATVTAAFVKLRAAIVVVSLVAALNPVGLVVTAMAAAAVLVIANWETVKSWFVDFFALIGNGARALSSLVPAWANGPSGRQAPALAPSVPSASMAGRSAVDLGGVIGVTVDDRRSFISMAKTNDNRFDFNVDAGMTMAGSY